MKNLIICFIGAVLFCSCSSSDSTEDLSKNLQDTPAWIQSYDSDVIGVCMQIDSLSNVMYPQQAETRWNWRKFFDKVKFVVVSDAIGGLLGGAVGSAVGAAAGAATASGIAIAIAVRDDGHISSAPPLQSIQMSDEDVALSSILLPDQSDSDNTLFQDSIGYNHNGILLSMKGIIYNGDYSVDELIENVADIASVNYNVSKSSILMQLNSNRLLYGNIKTNMTTVLEENESLDAYFAKMIALYPDKASELKLLERFVDGLFRMEIENNDGTYLNEVLKIIDRSSLDDATKLDLRNGFIVGHASNQLWSEQEN